MVQISGSSLKRFGLVVSLVLCAASRVEAQSAPTPPSALQLKYAEYYSVQACKTTLEAYNQTIKLYQDPRLNRNGIYNFIILYYQSVANQLKAACDQADAFRAQQVAYDKWVADQAAAKAKAEEEARKKQAAQPTKPSPAPQSSSKTPAQLSDALFGALPVNGPNDTYYQSNQVQNSLGLVDAMAGWKVNRDCSGAKVYVFDTGVDATHKDLANNVLAKEGFNFVTNKSDATDDHGHGTMVSGTIGALSNNSQGVAGVCWGAKIVPMKVLDSAGRGTTSTILSAVAEANKRQTADGPVSVYNLSISIHSSMSAELSQSVFASNGFKSIFDDSAKKNVVVVVASGNDGQNLGRPSNIAAAPKTLLVVGAIESTKQVTSFSNINGLTNIYAPGQNMVLPNRGGGYTVPGVSGTSFASPMVAGAVALYATAKPTLKAEQIKNDLISKASAISTKGAGDVRLLNLGNLMK